MALTKLQVEGRRLRFSCMFWKFSLKASASCLPTFRTSFSSTLDDHLFISFLYWCICGRSLCCRTVTVTQYVCSFFSCTLTLEMGQHWSAQLLWMFTTLVLLYNFRLIFEDPISMWAKQHHHQQQQQMFYRPLSGTTWVSRYQKKHSPTCTCHDHQPSFINFLCLLRSMASSLFNLYARQSFCTTSLQVLLVCLWIWNPPLHTPYVC